MKITPYARLVTIIFLFLSAWDLSAGQIAGGHRGNVTSIIHNGETVISSGEDGFIVIWNIRENAAIDRFQLTQHSIKSMVKHPLTDEICIIEEENKGDCRISAWNYKTKKRLFSLYSGESVKFINYSANGSFIIAGGFNGLDLALLDSINGELLSAPDIPAGTSVFAVTGNAERNMLIYQSEHEDYTPGYTGRMLYLDLNSASVTDTFTAPGNLTNPIIFGNNRFLAGINSSGLVIVDAATGAVFDTIARVGRATLLCPADNGFICLFRRNDVNIFSRFTFNSRGNFTAGRELPLPDTLAISAIAYNGNIVFADSDGSLFLINNRNQIIPIAYNFQTRITEIAASQNHIAFLTEEGELGFLPIDYNLIEEEFSMIPENKTGFTRITAVHTKGDDENDQFILWQTANRGAPQLVSAYSRTDSSFLENLTSRFPLCSISARDGRILVLDTSGNLTVRDFKNLSGNALFTFSSIGAIDAVFTDNENIIICRSVISGNSPFLIVNIFTGETVPVSYPSQAGIMVYAGNSGNIYGAVIEQNDSGLKTSILNLSRSAAADKRSIFDFQGEDVFLCAAESARMLAVSGGGDGAKIYGEEIIDFERTSGLPVKLLGTVKFFISLDSEGNISWHDNRTGKLLAVFRLYTDRWILSGERETSELRGLNF